MIMIEKGTEDGPDKLNRDFGQRGFLQGLKGRMRLTPRSEDAKDVPDNQNQKAED